MTPRKYFQIVTPDVNGVLRPFEVQQYGETESVFNTMDEAEQFINEHFDDYQEIGSDPRVERKDLVLSVIPVWMVRFKK